MRSPILLLIRMNAAETSASSAIADCTPLTVVSRSLTTAEIDTFMIDVSTTSTNIAIASNSATRLSPITACGGLGPLTSFVPPSGRDAGVLAEAVDVALVVGDELEQVL